MHEYLKVGLYCLVMGVVLFGLYKSTQGLFKSPEAAVKLTEVIANPIVTRTPLPMEEGYVRCYRTILNRIVEMGEDSTGGEYVILEGGISISHAFRDEIYDIRESLYPKFLALGDFSSKLVLSNWVRLQHDDIRTALDFLQYLINQLPHPISLSDLEVGDKVFLQKQMLVDVDKLCRMSEGIRYAISNVSLKDLIKSTGGVVCKVLDQQDKINWLIAKGPDLPPPDYAITGNDGQLLLVCKKDVTHTPSEPVNITVASSTEVHLYDISFVSFTDTPSVDSIGTPLIRDIPT